MLFVVTAAFSRSHPRDRRHVVRLGSAQGRGTIGVRLKNHSPIAMLMEDRLGER